jgi:hypothetical protein
MSETTDSVEGKQGEPRLTEEMAATAEPLSPTEKKLIGYSLGLGVALLIILVWVTRCL